MPEEKPKPITFTHKEIAEALVKYAGLKEGRWGIYIEFGITGANIGTKEDLTPAAIVPVVKIGLQRFPNENNLTVDAASLSKSKRSTGSKS